MHFALGSCVTNILFLVLGVELGKNFVCAGCGKVMLFSLLPGSAQALGAGRYQTGRHYGDQERGGEGRDGDRRWQSGLQVGACSELLCSVGNGGYGLSKVWRGSFRTCGVSVEQSRSLLST